MNPGWPARVHLFPVKYLCSYMRLTGKRWTRAGDLTRVGSQPGFMLMGPKTKAIRKRADQEVGGDRGSC